MNWKKFFVGFISIFFIISIFIYWFLPFEEIQFGVNKNPNFNIGNISTKMQFYKNMRFPDSKISYKIDKNCTLKKKSEMIKGFNYLDNLTLLEFYPVLKSEEIGVNCNEKSKTSKSGLFIAGEGGPTKITSGKNFNIIFKGNILLLRESSCERPNIEIHELLHALGFDHSKNKNNIMYPVTKCSQTIGKDLLNKIKKLYSFPSYPDLKIENVSAEISGRYLQINISVRNIGLSDSKKGELIIYGDKEILKKFDFKKIKVGYGLNIKLENIWVSKRKIEKLKVSIETKNKELSLINNQITLTKISG